MCDLNVITANKSIPVHKLVLASNSEYFKKIFTSDLISSDIKEIHVDEIEPNILEILIDFMYLSRINIDEHNVMVLFIYIFLHYA